MGRPFSCAWGTRFSRILAVVAVVAFGTIISASESAAQTSRVLCRKKNGLLLLRVGLCGKGQEVVDFAEFGIVGPPGADGSDGPRRAPRAGRARTGPEGPQGPEGPEGLEGPEGPGR